MTKVMGLKEATLFVMEKLTTQQISNLLGVTTNQVYKYSVGATRSCGDKVVDNFYDNFGILIDYYLDENEYIKYRKLRKRDERDDV